MIGKTISHYKILEKLGQGGMGVVYKAQDTKLDRTVALKFLPGQFSINQEEKTRFIHEAKAAAALDHPNICTIHEIGETDDGQMFIAMACYEGQTLKDKINPVGAQHVVPLSIDEAINIAIQIADGLHEAHEKNVIHRDIKSANIIITDKGQVKILDFGLAQLRGATKLTKEGTTLGTIDYMSPEQASGERVDHRSDIWSLGVILYELISGQLPFKGDYEQAIVYSIMNEQPEPITGLRTGIPLELEKIINKTLSKDPSERYQHTDELIVDLKKISQQIEKPVKAAPSMVTKEKQTGVNLRKIALPIVGVIFITFMFFFLKNIFLSKPEKPIDSIAVLPLENLSGDPEQEYFADGMTDALIGELARINALKVISRTSVMQYKKVHKPIPEIGKELNVKSIVEGTIMHSGNRVLIRIQLIETATDHHLWANDFESELKDILILQQEIARKIAREIKITLTPQEQTLLSSADTVDPRAIDLYLQAQQFFSKSTIKDDAQAKQYLEKAIDISPGFAKPYALLAECYGRMHLTQGLPAREVFPIARALAEKAIQLDKTLSLAHLELALILFFYDWDWVGAEKEFKRAIELQPGSPKAHNYYGFALGYLGRFDEAIQEMRRSIDLNPLYLNGWCNLVDVLITARRFDEAIETGLRAVRLTPEHPTALLRLGQAYSAKGLYEKAIPILERSVKLSGGHMVFKMFLGRAYAMADQREKAVNVFDEVLSSSDKGNFPSVYIAGIYLGLGEHKKALEHLEIAFAEREMDILSIKEIYWWDPLRDHPRFKDLLRRLNFPD